MIFQVIGAIPMVLGAILLIWAVIMLRENLSVFASPQKEGKLVTKGIFAYIRHPIYAGIILMAIGYGIYMDDSLKILIGLLILVFFELKSSYEEKRLIQHYPEYADYKLSTAKFLPAFMHFKITKVEKDESSASSEDAENENNDGNY